MIGNVLDIFRDEAFGLVPLTESINLLPHQPKRLGELGLFQSEGIDDDFFAVEFNKGNISLVPSAVRGTSGRKPTPEQSVIRTFSVLHMPQEDVILPRALRGLRQLGTADQRVKAADILNKRLEKMRRNQEATEEWLRCGAIQGKIIDGDGSTERVNLFTEFGISETTVDFEFSDADNDVGEVCIDVKRAIETALGDAQYDHVHVFCGAAWFKTFISHPNVQFAYQFFNQAAALREDVRNGFVYKDVVFEEYRGTIGSSAFINTDVARAVPVGVDGLFKTYYGPGDFMDSVGQIGVPLYAKQEVRKFDKGIDLWVESNALPMCTRPNTLIKLTKS